MSSTDYKLTRPVRSTLFSLRPIGIGTAHTESLESFTCRLAKEHQVTRHTIEQRVNHHGESLYQDASQPPRLDSPTALASEFGRRLATLTMRPDVVGLGLGRLAGHLSTMHTLRNYRAWCGDCFCEARDAAVPAHLLLVWSFADYRHCLKHGQMLETECSHCKRRSVASSSWSLAIDHCPWCHKDLAQRRVGETPSFAHLAGRQDVDINLFCSRVLGEFVAQTSGVLEPPVACDVDAAVRSALTRGLASSRADFSRKAGLSNPTLHCVVTGKNNPSLAVLLRIAAAADVSMAGIFYPHLRQENVRGPAPDSLRSAPRLRVNQKRDWDQIRRQAKTALAAGQAISLQQLSRKLGVDQSHLAANIGELRDDILQRGREVRKATRQKRMDDLTASVKQARASLIAEHLRVSGRSISEIMNVSVKSAYMRRAIKSTRA